MANSMTYMRLWVVVFLGLALHLSAETSEVKHSWEFQGEYGKVEIVLLTSIRNNGASTLSMDIYPSSSNRVVARSVVEEARFISSVMVDMAREGIDIHSLTSINFRLNEIEALDRVASYAAQSVQWRDATQKRNLAKVYDLLTVFLNECGAYKEWDEVFRRYGLSLKVAGVEEVIMEPFERLGIQCPTRGYCKNLIVPEDASVQMNVLPIH
jgi:hypothetical protein